MTPLVLLIATVASPPAAPADATRLTFSAPAAIVEIDLGKLKGEPVRLAWSPDAAQLYLQTAEQDGRGGVRQRHFVVGLNGQQPKGVGDQPPWAAEYWTWKSAQAAPGMASMKIGVEQEQKRVTSTSTPMGGNLARGDPDTGGSPGTGMGVSVEEAARAAEQSQMVNVFTLRLKGEVIGEFVNSPALPGLTFGWGPSGSGLIVFATKAGRLVVMDDQGRKKELDEPKAALLPAWTGDGSRVVYLERTGKKKCTLRVVDVTIP